MNWNGTEDRAASTEIFPPDGVVLVDKPAGITSFDVIRRLRFLSAGLARRRKVGHTGTLDPFATGLLPLCLGEATKLAPLIVAGEKEYIGTVRLGEKTDTGDREGSVCQRCPVPALPGAAGLDEILRSLEGTHRQTPPMHSAVKVGGEPLYVRARRGESVDRPAREIVVHRIEALEVRLPEIVFRVECSKGTYVRILAEAIAEALGTVGHLDALRRTRVGGLSVERAASIEEILAGARDSLPGGWWIGLDDCVPEAPVVDLDTAAAQKVLHGWIPPEVERLWPEGAAAGGSVRIRCQGRLVALAGRDADSGPVRLFRVLVRPETTPAESPFRTS